MVFFLQSRAAEKEELSARNISTHKVGIFSLSLNSAHMICPRTLFAYSILENCFGRRYNLHVLVQHQHGLRIKSFSDLSMDE